MSTSDLICILNLPRFRTSGRAGVVFGLAFANTIVVPWGMDGIISVLVNGFQFSADALIKF